MANDIALDSCAWIDYLLGNKEGVAIRKAVDGRTIVTSAITVAEVVDWCLRESRPVDDAVEFIRANAWLVPVDENLAVQGAKCKHAIRKINQKFGLADGIQLATAQSCQAELVTTDTDFIGVEGARVL